MLMGLAFIANWCGLGDSSISDEQSVVVWDIFHDGNVISVIPFPLYKRMKCWYKEIFHNLMKLFTRYSVFVRMIS